MGEMELSHYVTKNECRPNCELSRTNMNDTELEPSTAWYNVARTTGGK